MMRVYNEDREVELVSRGERALTFWTRGRGLMGRTSFEPGEGLLIEPCNSIHCFFMRIPIDVLYLDDENRVLDVDVQMRPWRVGKPRWTAAKVLELPAGTVQRSATRVGDRLAIQ